MYKICITPMHFVYFVCICLICVGSDIQQSECVMRDANKPARQPAPVGEPAGGRRVSRIPNAECGIQQKSTKCIQIIQNA